MPRPANSPSTHPLTGRGFDVDYDASDVLSDDDGAGTPDGSDAPTLDRISLGAAGDRRRSSMRPFGPHHNSERQPRCSPPPQTFRVRPDDDDDAGNPPDPSRPTPPPSPLTQTQRRPTTLPAAAPAAAPVQPLGDGALCQPTVWNIAPAAAITAWVVVGVAFIVGMLVIGGCAAVAWLQPGRLPRDVRCPAEVPHLTVSVAALSAAEAVAVAAWLAFFAVKLRPTLRHRRSLLPQHVAYTIAFVAFSSSVAVAVAAHFVVSLYALSFFARPGSNGAAVDRACGAAYVTLRGVSIAHAVAVAVVCGAGLVHHRLLRRQLRSDYPQRARLADHRLE
jgi:hypothetical protein